MVNLGSNVPQSNCRRYMSLPRNTLRSYLRDQGKIPMRIPNISLKNVYKTPEQEMKHDDGSWKMRKDCEKGDSIKPRKLFPVKKVSSAISGFFCHKSDDSRKTGSDNVEADQKVFKTTESIRNIRRVSSSLLSLRHKLKIRRSVTDKAEEEDDVVGEELCKKRILMGGKCKPLSRSGTLEYDETGVLLAESSPEFY